MECSNPRAPARTIATRLLMLGDARPATLLGSGTCQESVLLQGIVRGASLEPPGTLPDLGSLARATRVSYTLNRMVQYSAAALDTSFAALSDSTRRGVLLQLGRGDASISALAGKFRMTLTGMKKHVGVLERARLVTTEKVGRVRTCRLGPRRLEDETAWIEGYRRLWAERFDALDEVIEELKRKERAP